MRSLPRRQSFFGTCRPARVSLHYRSSANWNTGVTIEAEIESANIASRRGCDNHLPFINDDQRKVVFARLLQSVRTAGTGEDRVARFNRKFLVVHLHHAFAAEYVIDLVLFLQVVADGRAGVQRAFSEDLFEAGGLLEETVAGRTSRAAVRGGAGFGHLGVAFENVAFGGGLRL